MVLVLDAMKKCAVCERHCHDCAVVDEWAEAIAGYSGKTVTSFTRDIARSLIDVSIAINTGEYAGSMQFFQLMSSIYGSPVLRDDIDTLSTSMISLVSSMLEAGSQCTEVTAMYIVMSWLVGFTMGKQYETKPDDGAFRALFGPS